MDSLANSNGAGNGPNGTTPLTNGVSVPVAANNGTIFYAGKDDEDDGGNFIPTESQRRDYAANGYMDDSGSEEGGASIEDIPDFSIGSGADQATLNNGDDAVGGPSATQNPSGSLGASLTNGNGANGVVGAFGGLNQAPGSMSATLTNGVSVNGPSAQPAATTSASIGAAQRRIFENMLRYEGFSADDIHSILDLYDQSR
ncbi:uncharacterized protein RAG0_15143 [Rhynchosporium agropyri]|uniref:Uncharacterized protein n=1 Tax=Rhynchosporium agropyri TaxID=914238 RepID=A0A1E1LJW9_9HELO|nr:uncharacterized protein RAG0_15143 [Rhynchosporium agropyri]